jgi:hypothetical protein
MHSAKQSDSFIQMEERGTETFSPKKTCVVAGARLDTKNGSPTRESLPFKGKLGLNDRF